MNHTMKTNDILSGSWGYDQTTPEFYQVVSVTAKTVKVMRIASEMVEKHGVNDSMSGEVMPTPNHFLNPNTAPIVCKVINGIYGEYIKPRVQFMDGTFGETRVHAHKWDGAKKYSSWYA